MATIERKPLPPFNSTVTNITEADRAEIIARANDVINHYLSGPGSYFDAGPRKPLTGEGDTTVADLNRFKDYVIGSKQYADDPNRILDSVIELIDGTIGRVERADRFDDGEHGISHPPPSIPDPIERRPPLTGLGPANNSRLGIQANMANVSTSELAPTRERAASADNVDPKDIRVLSSRILAPGVAPSALTVANQGWPTNKPLGLVTGQPMPEDPMPPWFFGLPDRATSNGDDMDDWYMRWVKPFSNHDTLRRDLYVGAEHSGSFVFS
jgi:hypothetical protein